MPWSSTRRAFTKLLGRLGSSSKGLDLGLFDLFKDVKDNELLDEEEITITEEEQDAGANV